MKKIVTLFIAVLFVCVCLTACELPFFESVTDSQQDVNVQIDSLPYGLSSLTETNDAYAKFSAVLDAVSAPDGSMQEIKLELLGEKCLTFYNSYLELCEESDEASDAVGNLFDDETCARLTNIYEQVSDSGVYSFDSDGLTSVITAFTGEYNVLLQVEGENEYFTVSDYTYETVRANAETALQLLNSSILYYEDDSLSGSERAEKITASLSSATQCIEINDNMHAQTLEKLDEYASNMLLFVEKAGAYME